MEASSATSELVFPAANDGGASMMVSEVAALMAIWLQEGQLFSDPSRFNGLCSSLANGMDYAIANNEVPIRSRELPAVLRQVYKCPHIHSFPVGLMLLTMSVKCACNLDWFLNQDTDDLLKIANEVMETFSDPEQYFLIEPTHAFCWLSYVISRFYPRMKIQSQQMLFSLELLSGRRFCVASFPIIRGTVSLKHAKMYLFVIQLDNMRECSCITLPDVNILLNGHEAVVRAISSTEKRPQQHPIDVSGMIKYGVNCLQAIGLFKGNFLIAIAAINDAQSHNSSGLQYYARPSASTDPDEKSTRATIPTTRSAVHQDHVELNSSPDPETKREAHKDVHQDERVDEKRRRCH